MATFHFVGSTGANLALASNWSATQGGAGGAGTPGGSDTAIFDQTNASQITVTAAQDFGTLQVAITAKVKVQSGSGIRHIGNLVNHGLLTLAGGPVFTQDTDTQEVTWGTNYFVIGNITNDAALYTDNSLVLTGSVTSQSGIFGTSGYIWGTVPDGDLANLYLASPGGSLAPGTYGFGNIGQPSEISGTTQNADELIDFFLTAPFTCTLTSGGVYHFFGFGGTSSDTQPCTYTLDGTTIYTTGIGFGSHGAQATVNALGTKFNISAPPTNVGSFLFGQDSDTTVLNWNASTEVNIVPGLVPESNISVLGGYCDLPKFTVASGTLLALFNPLELPKHLDSLNALPGSGVLLVDNHGGPVVVANDFIMTDTQVSVIGPNSDEAGLEIGGDFIFSGGLRGGPNDEGLAASLSISVEGSFTVTGTRLDDSGTLGDTYHHSFWNTGGFPFTQSTTLDIGGTIDVKDLEVYHVFSEETITSPSSFGCWNVRLDIVSNCPGRRDHWDNQTSPGANEHPIEEISPSVSLHQGDRWHKTIQAQTATRITDSITSSSTHKSDLSWRRGRARGQG